MKKFKGTYKKLTSILLFIIFFGVIISDLVSFHLKHIYHVELINHNLKFVKLTKDSSKTIKKFVASDLFTSLFFTNSQTKEIKIGFLKNYLGIEKFCFKEIVIQNNILPLRAPPISL